MLRTVSSPIPKVLYRRTRHLARPYFLKGKVYEVYVTKHGTIHIWYDDRRRVKIKPEHFEIVSWHDEVESD